MASHLLWFRLKSGKVWHVSVGRGGALCGQIVPQFGGERQPKRPPTER